MKNESNIDVLVVGAGPAGISAALACHEFGLNYVVLERGPDLGSRRRADSIDIASGVGGAGLFSDGKFSFFPAATNLWGLKPERHLRQAYQRVSTIIEEQKIKTPLFPENTSLTVEANSHGDFLSKTYESKYMPLESRYALIERFRNKLGDCILTRCAVTDIEIPNDSPIRITILEDGSAEDSQSYSLYARVLIVASGRFGPLLLQRILPSELLTYRRLEVGFRIQQAADKFFLRSAETLDPKLIWRRGDGLYEWRTFCCCRNGEIVSVLGDNVLSVSGRSDLLPTGYSSVGFHARLLEPAVAEPAWRLLRERVAELREAIVEPLEVFLGPAKASSSRLYKLFGPDLAGILEEGLYRLFNTFETARTDAVLYGPAIEGVLYYPLVDQELRLSTFPVWVAGDASGQFRGLTAALVSGYFSGIRVADHLGMFE